LCLLVVTFPSLLATGAAARRSDGTLQPDSTGPGSESKKLAVAFAQPFQKSGIAVEIQFLCAVDSADDLPSGGRRDIRKSHEYFAMSDQKIAEAFVQWLEVPNVHLLVYGTSHEGGFTFDLLDAADLAGISYEKETLKSWCSCGSDYCSGSESRSKADSGQKLGTETWDAAQRRHLAKGNATAKGISGDSGDGRSGNARLQSSARNSTRLLQEKASDQAATIGAYSYTFHGGARLTKIINMGALQYFNSDSASKLDALLADLPDVTHLVYGKPHEEKYWESVCSEAGGAYNGEGADNGLGDCSMRDQSCRDSDMLFETIGHHMAASSRHDGAWMNHVVADSPDRVYDTADLDWPKADTTVWLEPHVCRTVCVCPGKYSGEPKDDSCAKYVMAQHQSEANCELTAGAAWAYDILNDLGLAY